MSKTLDRILEGIDNSGLLNEEPPPKWTHEHYQSYWDHSAEHDVLPDNTQGE